MKDHVFRPNDDQHERSAVQMKVWDPGITHRDILKQHLEDKDMCTNKRMLEMSKDDLIPAIDENPKKCTTCMITKITRKPFQSITRKSVILELIHSELCDFHATPSLGNKNSLYTTTKLCERKNRALKEMVNSMLSYSGLSEGFWGEAMLTACYLLNRIPNKRNKTTLYELWYKKRPNLAFFRVWGCRAVVRLPDQNGKLWVKGPKDIIPNSDESQRDDLSDDVPNELPEPRKVLRRILEPIMKLCNLEILLFGKKQLTMRLVLLWKIIHGVLSDLPSSCKPLGCKWIFKRKMKVDGIVDKFKARLIAVGLSSYSQSSDPSNGCQDNNGDLDEEVYMKQPKGFIMPGNEHKLFDKTKKFLSSRFSMKDMGEADVILGIKIKRENKGIVITQSHYIEKILKKFNREDCSPIHLLRVDGCSWLGGVVILWASKKQTCITGSTMESEFVALAAAGKEAEWLRNLIHEILIWPKPIAPISIRCDSAPTTARAYSQIYNGKSRHLGVRHSMVRELIRNGVISIEFVRTQHNLADHLTKGLARDLVYKSVIRMGLKSI
nr:zinc finger, CCHC-type [Tanacetum cinerariifolium]